MHTITSFAPISNPNATILILGSMPGIASLNAHQYYAHPRNAFWPIMSSIYHIDVNLPYEARISALQNNKVALWDVLQRCERQGSLDSAIKTGTRVPNDFDNFFSRHPKIRLIAFNGAEAESSFQKYVLADLKSTNVLQFIRLPSTSPAHAISLEKKQIAWHLALTLANS
jgi:double-stranded uracil-DNA glycosylase